MSSLRNAVRDEIFGDLERYPAKIVRKWRKFGIQREIDRTFVWQAFRDLAGIYRGRWSRTYPDVAVKLDAARIAMKELSDAMWRAER